MDIVYLALANGLVLPGRAVGARRESIGEMVFTTGMCGYIETLTDPSYAGQIVVHTFPMIGNVGIIEDDFEGTCAIRGYVVRECCNHPSNFRCGGTLDGFLRERDIPGVEGVDTRRLTRLIREEGVMNAGIFLSPPDNFDALRSYLVSGEVERVSCRKSCVFPAQGEAKYRVGLIDYGAKRGIIRELCKRGCEVTVYPQNTPAADILSAGYDGLMLSNGPGDPAENTYCIEQLKSLIGKLPIFGICLGHQLAALALGGETVKLKYGHRGVNQPVSEIRGSRTFITSQNHGYAVVSDSLRGVGEQLFINANDHTCEGMEYPGKNCFTVQFHPEACGGPRDTGFLFDRFIQMLGGGNT